MWELVHKVVKGHEAIKGSNKTIFCQIVGHYRVLMTSSEPETRTGQCFAAHAGRARV